MVLNTHFLSLILKLMKTSMTYGTNSTLNSRASSAGNNNNNNSTGGGGNTSQSAVCAAMNANAHQGRILASTVLALMLRYATILQPPTIRAREEHIVASIVSLLKENAKIDVKFKRRAVAALGETVFYITAQEEEPVASSPHKGESANPDRWVLPNQAVDTLVECIKEENDEITKHYAVKVRYIPC